MRFRRTIPGELRLITIAALVSDINSILVELILTLIEDPVSNSI